MPDIEKTSSQDKIKEITDKLEKGVMKLFEGDRFRLKEIYSALIAE